MYLLAVARAQHGNSQIVMRASSQLVLLSHYMSLMFSVGRMLCRHRIVMLILLYYKVHSEAGPC
jgi:hypothetical protein